jgi:hypothetical protein
MWMSGFWNLKKPLGKHKTGVILCDDVCVLSSRVYAALEPKLNHN